MGRNSRASGVERGRFIHDGPTYFRDSVVLYTRFDTAKLRQMFAYLREKEQLMRKDLDAFRGTPRETECKIRLLEIETQLIWMTANLR
jgi:hypothetical protein